MTKKIRMKHLKITIKKRGCCSPPVSNHSDCEAPVSQTQPTYDSSGAYKPYFSKRQDVLHRKRRSAQEIEKEVEENGR